MSVSISWALEDVTARSDSVVKGSYFASFCSDQDLKKEGVTPPKAATLEQDFWRLDGTFVPFPDNPKDTSWGLWSLYCTGDNCMPRILPDVLITFPNYHNFAGITLLFSPYEESYCSEIQIRWYNGRKLLAGGMYYPDSWRFVCEEKVENCNRIQIDLIKSSKPGRYCKLESVIYGLEKRFGPPEILSAEILEQMDLKGDSLPINSLQFSVFSTDYDFHILNPQGVYSLLQKRQALTVSGEQNGAYQALGTFYLEDWSQSSDYVFQMEGCDALGIMENTQFAGGMYTDIAARTLIETILDDAGFGYSLDGSLANRTLSGWLPRCSHREALRQAAFALGAVVDSSRSGILRIFPLSEATLGTIPRDRKVAGDTTVSLTPLITGVSVTGHSYSLGNSGTQLFKGDLEAGEQEILFSGPSQVDSVSGATLLESGVNFVKVNVAAAGTVTVTGKKYEDSTVIATKKMDDIPAGEKENLLEITDATLVSAGQAQAVAERVYRDCCRRIRQEMTLLPGTETLGSSYEVEVSEDIRRSGFLEEIEQDLIGGLTKVVVTGA